VRSSSHGIHRASVASFRAPCTPGGVEKKGLGFLLLLHFESGGRYECRWVCSSSSSSSSSGAL
jgi:hypothetical protein